MRIALIISLLLAIAAVVFALQNPATIDVKLGPFQLQGSTALILIITFCIGVLVGILATVPSLVKRRRRVRTLEKSAADTTTSRTSPDETDWTKPQHDVASSSTKESPDRIH